MNKYVCAICGFVFDEAEGTLWNDLADDWTCPLCGASKDVFELQKTAQDQVATSESSEMSAVRGLSVAELGSLFSNLSKGCEKQYKVEASELFASLASYYEQRRPLAEESDLMVLKKMLEEDVTKGYPAIKPTIESHGDRGALRAVVWNEKVTRMLQSLLGRYEKEGTDMLATTKAYVCDICGFVYVGDNVPEVCPVCKVPKMKLIEVKRG